MMGEAEPETFAKDGRTEMPQITGADVVPNPIALGQVGQIQLASMPTQGGALTGSVRISSGNDIFFVPQSSTITADPNGDTSFRLERQSSPGLSSPNSVIFFITVREEGVAAESKRQRLVDIIG